jgi:hypothetical protein
MLREASLGFRDFALQVGYRFPGLSAHLRIGDFANREPGSLQGLQGIAVLLELNPMPSDSTIAVSTHRETS